MVSTRARPAWIAATDHRQPGAGAPGAEQPQGSQGEHHRDEVEVRADHGAGEERRGGGGEERTPPVPARARGERSAEQDHRPGQHDGAGGEGQPVSVLSGAGKPGQRQRRRRERRVLERDVAVGQRAAEEELGVGAVDGYVAQALVAPRAGQQRRREGDGEQDERGAPHAATGARSARAGARADAASPLRPR